MLKSKLIPIAGMLCLGAIGAQAADPVETRAHYSTNPGGAVGRAATITIDGEFNDWTDDMIIATCGANDMATAFKGSHENCVLDLYCVYAAWDDTNLYIAWQMCNTGDVWARPGDGPLTDAGRIGDVPLIVALSVDPSSTCMNGHVKDGRFIWMEQTSGITYQSHVDHLLFMSGKPGNGDPAMFVSVDNEGNSSYESGKGFKSFRDLGISYKMKEGFAPSHLWRQNKTAEWSSPTDLVSDPSVVNSIYDADNYDNLREGTPSGLKKHDYKFDSFYEINIPLSALGITRRELESTGIGCRVIATRGESALDCCPWDPAMMDNALGEYGKDNSTTHEKDDVDTITYATASVGHLRDGQQGAIGNVSDTPAAITADGLSVSAVDGLTVYSVDGRLIGRGATVSVPAPGFYIAVDASNRAQRLMLR